MKTLAGVQFAEDASVEVPFLDVAYLVASAEDAWFVEAPAQTVDASVEDAYVALLGLVVAC